jgi:hypothetical protein
MRFIPLSDHAGELLRQARRGRAGAGQRDEERYRRELAAYDTSVGQAREQRDQAVAHWRLLSALRWGLAVWRRKRAGPPPPPARRGPSRNEAALEAGAEGEREVHDALDRALDDSWALFKGYRNPGGEIDYLLIGPQGLFAIEVKHVNGAFRVAAERWLYRRYDGYGNEVGDVMTLADRGGRPPQVQLAEPLGQLARFLAKRGQPVPWQSVVLLNHPRVKVLSCADGLGAQILTSTDQLLDLVRGADGVVGSGQLGEIGRLIERDHRFQADRRRSERTDSRDERVRLGLPKRENPVGAQPGGDDLAGRSVQELGDGRDELIGVIEPGEVAGARLDDQPRMGEQRSELGRRRWRSLQVKGAADDKHGRA